jgi:hypothetical protein
MTIFGEIMVPELEREDDKHNGDVGQVVVGERTT